MEKLTRISRKHFKMGKNANNGYKNGRNEQENKDLERFSYYCHERFR